MFNNNNNYNNNDNNNSTQHIFLIIKSHTHTWVLKREKQATSIIVGCIPSTAYKKKVLVRVTTRESYIYSSLGNGFG